MFITLKTDFFRLWFFYKSNLRSSIAGKHIGNIGNIIDQVSGYCCKSDQVSEYCCKSDQVSEYCCESDQVSEYCCESDQVSDYCCESDQVLEYRCVSDQGIVVNRELQILHEALKLRFYKHTVL